MSKYKKNASIPEYKTKSVKKEANFFFRGNYTVAVTHQYHQRILQESASKNEFVTFAVKDILLGFMATKPGIKIEQVMPMSLFLFSFSIDILLHIHLKT